MAEPSADDLVRVANHFLLNSPPGEFSEVVTDVRKLLPDPNLINASAPRTFREYNTEQMVQVESPNHTHKVLITKFGEVGDGEYLDPAGNQVLIYDHIKQSVVSTRPITTELDGTLEPVRSAFEKAAFDYVAAHYPHGSTSVYGKDGEIIIAISAARFNPSNMWNGRWRAVWRYSPGSGELNGSIRVAVHIYEQGNIQLTSSTKLKATFTEGTAEVSATNALAAVLKAEAEFQKSLDSHYQTMGETTFKAMRRQLPMFRTKINWNQIMGYKLGGDMAKA